MKKSLSAVILILGLFSPVLAAKIQSVSDNGPVGKWEKFEVNYDLGKTYSNPFDPSEVDVTVEFKSPSGKVHTVQGFIFQDYKRTGNFKKQTLTPVGGVVWKARFAPDTEGVWSYTLKAKDSTGTATAPSRSFTVTASKSKGFVRISSQDPEYFAFDNGQSYFPLGENMGWASGGRTYQYDKWVGGLSAMGGNYIRLWQAPWFTEIEWADSYPDTTKLPGNYTDRLKEAWELDYILNLCAKKNVYALLCLINHGKFSSETNPTWDKNPYNKKANPKGGFLDRPEELWTNEKAKMYIQRNWRYLIARYAHYTSLQSWELFNEMEWINHYGDSVKASAQFHKVMGDYLKANDPYRHLVTTSYASALKWPTDVWNSGMQFTQEHNYGGQDMAQVVDSITGAMRAKVPHKPFYIGEIGIGGSDGEHKKDPTGIFIHNTNWGSFTAKAAGGGFPWWWDNYVGPDNLYHRWKGIAEFVAGEDLDRQGYQPTAFTVFSPQKSDLSFSPGNNAWGVKAGANKFILSPDGSISPPESNLTTFLYSNSKAQFRNPPVFHVELSKPGPFKVLLGDLSKVEPNKLTILLDGKPTSVNKTIAKAHSAYGVDVPAGAHDISVDSTGADWVQVASYSIGGYAGALRCKALNGKNKVLGRVQSRSFTYGSKERPEVKGAVLHLSGLKQDGSWKVEWWDAEKGVKTGTTQINVKKGNADLPLPAITKDLAFKAIATVNVP